MRAAVFSVGTEILLGEIINTNTVFISRQLNLLGFDVLYHYTAGDNPKRLRGLLERAFEETDLVIITGGLGPTEDDLTKETVAELMNDQLIMDEESLKNIFKRAKRTGFKVTENNFKQAMLPENGVIFENDRGTAPGFALEKDGHIAICMPGPPKEMENMWEKQVKPFLMQFQDSVLRYRTLRFFGISESELETALLPVIDGQTDPTIATYAHEGECSVRIASKRPLKDEAEEAIDEMAKKIDEIVGRYIYSFDDEDFNVAVGKKLIERNISFSVCESCTGGRFAFEMVKVPGISKVFDRGLVTYSLRAKREELGVKEETLKTYTAVSKETALEMAQGLRDKTGSDLCISVTGVAGPGPDGDKPAGLIYIGIVYGDTEKVMKLETGRNDREKNIRLACLNMLNLINRTIEPKELL